MCVCIVQYLFYLSIWNYGIISYKGSWYYGRTLFCTLKQYTICEVTNTFFFMVYSEREKRPRRCRWDEWTHRKCRSGLHPEPPQPSPLPLPDHPPSIRLGSIRQSNRSGEPDAAGGITRLRYGGLRSGGEYFLAIALSFRPQHPTKLSSLQCKRKHHSYR